MSQEQFILIFNNLMPVITDRSQSVFFRENGAHINNDVPPLMACDSDYIRNYVARNCFFISSYTLHSNEHPSSLALGLSTPL